MSLGFRIDNGSTRRRRNNRTLSVTEECSQRIAQRVRRKKQSQKKLSTVEAHLINTDLKDAFRPSPWLVTSEVISIFAKPLPLLIILSLVLVAENSSSAWFASESNPSSLALASSDMNSRDFSNIEDDSTLLDPMHDQKRSADLASTIARAALNQASLNRDTEKSRQVGVPGLIEFISGVIAVYYPAEKNPGEIARHIVEVSLEEDIDPLYVASVIAVESSFRSHARSRVGATGLMQVMPATAKHLFRQQYGAKARPTLTDPRVNIRLGISYLKDLERNYRGNRFHVLAAYNWGPGNLAKARRGTKRIPKSVRAYANKILETTLRWHKHFERAVESASSAKKKGAKNS